jgi:hypothetical protein
MKSTSLFFALLALSLSFARAEYEPVDISGVRDKITIRMGRKASYVFDQRGDRLVNPRPAPPNTKQPVITVTLLKWKDQQILRVGSTFPRVVRYHSAASDKDSHGYRRVNRMFGLLPKVPVEEMFGLPISEFVLYDFTLRNERIDSMTTNETIGW